MPQKIRIPDSYDFGRLLSGIDTLKNWRSTTETKMSMATMPTKIAASSSIASMNRSMRLRRGGKLPPRALGSATVSLTQAGLVRRLVLGQIGLERGQRLVGIDAGALGALGPLRGQRRRRLAPGGELLGGELIDLVSRFFLDLGAAGHFPFGPGRGDLLGPGGVAVIVDHLLLRRRHRVVFRLVQHPDEGRDVERRIHMVLGRLVDAEQNGRVPRKGD